MATKNAFTCGAVSDIAPFDVAFLEAEGIPQLPTDRAALRRHLLDAIARIRPILEADAEANDDAETLAWPSVVALYREGLLSLKVPRELGGPEVDPHLYLELCDELCYVNPSAGWCAFINSTSASWLGAFLPDAGVERIFGNGGMPIASGALIPRGQATPVDGGWRVSGRWPFASGSAHSSWLLAGFRIVRDDGPGREHMIFAAPIADVQFVDNWQVMGLKGTGSRDFVFDDYFVPEDMAFDLMSTDPRKGGPLFWLGRPGFVTPDHAAFALGVARRALDEIFQQAGSYQRGYLTSTIAQRGALHHDLGKCDQQLRAARALCREAIEDAWEFCLRGERPDLERQLRLRGACVYATDVACDVTTAAFRYGGGDAIYNDRVLQRCMRDINAAAQHFMVNTSAYDNLGQFRLGLPDVNPMG
jgi:alkylation response protein AidB-like acyl-CoA dehydrogenase